MKNLSLRDYKVERSMDIPSIIESFAQQGDIHLAQLLESVANLKNCNPETLMPNFYELSRFLAKKNEEGLIIPLILALIRLQQGERESFAKPATPLNSSDSHEPIAEEGMVDKAIKFMKMSLASGQQLSLKMLCYQLHTNATTLISCFNQETESSPMQFWIRLRLEQAAQLLAETKLSILRISEICLYENQANFANSFKKCYGVSPSSYRKRMT